jgi:hypothetical protein
MLKLKADPTFKATVSIPLPGGTSEPVEFTFTHRTRSQIEPFMKDVETKTNAEVFESIVVGWSLEDDFCRVNVERLLDNYLGALRVVTEAYLRELAGLRLGN